MALQASWLDHVFAKLTVRYGAAFIRQWADADPEYIKADWAEVLAGMPGYALSYGLRYLPNDPPNAIQFRNLCRLAPTPNEAPQLAAPKEPVDPEVMRRIRTRLQQLRRQLTEQPARPSCLDVLLQRQAAGEQLSAGQLGYIEACMAVQSDVSKGLFDVGTFRPIPPGVQPAGSAQRAAADFFNAMRRASAPPTSTDGATA